MGQGLYCTKCLGPHHLCGGKGDRRARGNWARAIQSVWIPTTCVGARGSKRNKTVSVTEAQRLPRLPKVPGRSQGTKEGQKQEEQRGAREQGPWVWLRPQGYRRLPKAPKASWGLREVLEDKGGSGGEGEWGTRESKTNKTPEASRLPKASEGSQGFLSPPGDREAQGLPKTSEGSQGFLRPQGGARVPGRFRDKGS